MTLKFGERSFSYAGPPARNSLLHHVQEITNITDFKRQLRTLVLSYLKIKVNYALTAHSNVNNNNNDDDNDCDDNYTMMMIKLK